MCGRYNITDDPLTRVLCEQLGLFEQLSDLRFSDDVAPASTVSMIAQDQNARYIVDADWWLLQQFTEEGFKANYKYPSFNSRSDKLNNPKSIAYQPYRQSRCIIPASNFVEGQDKRYHQLTPVDSAIAFGGLYKSWINNDTGQMTHSCSIITLPGNPKLAHIHKKSLPLMLPFDDQSLVDAWLDPNFSQVEAFNELLEPTLRYDIKALPVDKPSKRNPIGLEELIHKD